ncbi:MAG: hypothetical protein AAF570_20715, partial [Bacteroidota bacterium]
MDSILVGPGYFEIYATLCIGGGITGANRGADNDTRAMAFAFYTPGSGPINLLAFTPDTITG